MHSGKENIKSLVSILSNTKRKGGWFQIILKRTHEGPGETNVYKNQKMGVENSIDGVRSRLVCFVGQRGKQKSPMGDGRGSCGGEWLRDGKKACRPGSRPKKRKNPKKSQDQSTKKNTTEIRNRGPEEESLLVGLVLWVSGGGGKGKDE